MRKPLDLTPEKAVIFRVTRRNQVQGLGARADATLDEQAARIAVGVTDFKHWLEGHFTIQSIKRELPLLGLDANGFVVSGTAYLAVKNRTVSGSSIISSTASTTQPSHSSSTCRSLNSTRLPWRTLAMSSWVSVSNGFDGVK